MFRGAIMLADSYQVVDVLMLVGNILPLAVYFLVLGLINSHAHPCLITSRSDFLALTSVMLPVLLWPVPEFVRAGMYGPLLAGLLIAALVFYYMLPARDAGFVVYNISRSRCLKLFEQASRGLGLRGSWHDNVWSSEDADLSVELREFSLLHNVALHIDVLREDARPLVHGIGVQLAQRLGSVSQLPSTMGAGLVVVGVMLLIFPMWMVGRHIEDIVDAMTHIFG